MIILASPAIPRFMREDFAIPASVRSVWQRLIFKPVSPVVLQPDYFQSQAAPKAIKNYKIKNSLFPRKRLFYYEKRLFGLILI
ncbi:hypothetical protein ASL14_22670 [Paenibacillus sp. IHB B 3084]|nr:hypothetical protein ASL14_22670 [Paenibacillus sp. IHB B 3084]